MVTVVTGPMLGQPTVLFSFGKLYLNSAVLNGQCLIILCRVAWPSRAQAGGGMRTVKTTPMREID